MYLDPLDLEFEVRSCSSFRNYIHNNVFNTLWWNNDRIPQLEDIWDTENAISNNISLSIKSLSLCQEELF